MAPPPTRLNTSLRSLFFAFHHQFKISSLNSKYSPPMALYTTHGLPLALSLLFAPKLL